MYCIHCGKQLPDEAKFCFHCGKQTVTEQEIPAEPAQQIESEQKVLEEKPALEQRIPAEQNKKTDAPVQNEPEPQEEPEWQWGNTVEESAEEVSKKTPAAKEKKAPIAKEQKPAKPMIDPQAKTKAKQFVKSKKGMIILGAAALVILLLIVILCVSGGSKISVPDPDVYFGMQHMGDEKVKKNSADEYVYCYQNTDNMLPAMGGYVRLLYEEYDFVLTNTDGGDSESVTYYLLGTSVDQKIKLTYYPEGENNFFVTFSDSIKVHDKGERYQGRINTSSGSNIIDKLNDPSYWESVFAAKGWRLSAAEDQQNSSGEQDHAELTADLAAQAEMDEADDLPEELKNRDPALIPCPLDYDPTGSFRHGSAVTFGEDESILWIYFTAKPADLSYVGWDYIELLKKMGYEVVEELNNGVMLSHPDVDAEPVFNGVRTDDPASPGQIEVRLPVFSDEDACQIHIQYLGGSGIEMDGYVGKFEELRAKDADHFYNGDSDDDGGYDVPEVNKDLYDQKTPCGSCDDGDCKTCGGDGYLWSSASDKEDRNCYNCNRGSCRRCGGDGWL